MPLVSGDPAIGWQDEPQTTSIAVLADVAEDLGDAFRRARTQQELLFGYTEHSVTTTYLGASTGLRRRGVQPHGRLEFNAKTADRASSAWVGAATRDFSDVDVAALHAELSTRLGWARNKISLPPGHYETAAAARSRCRPDDLSTLDGRRARRRRRAERLLRRRRQDQGRPAAHRAADHSAVRPVLPSAGMPALRRLALDRPERVAGVRRRPGHRWRRLDLETEY